MKRSRLTSLSNQVQRIEYCDMHVDIVTTPSEVIRVGGMPDIVKFLEEHGIHEDIVVVPDWEVSMAGDNRTGEEFILWKAEIAEAPPKKYVGERHNVEQLHHHLDQTFPYFFDEARVSVVRTQWLDKWFHLHVAQPEFKQGSLTIRCEDGNVVISDQSNFIYNRDSLKPNTDVSGNIESMLDKLTSDNAPRTAMEIMPIGCGNGFHGTPANTIIRYEDHVVWIDPCGYPAQTLARHNVHWDDITHFLFTHNHEDHVQGFTACVQRAHHLGRKINLLVTDNTFELLDKLYSPLFPNLSDHVNKCSLNPGTPFDLGSMKIESRWNHHILPYGTIGLRFTAGNKCFGYSGDTKFDTTLNTLLNRKELTADWFASCDLVFHEIDFDNPNSVHTHWKQVELLQQEISGVVLGYHTSSQESRPFPLAKEGYRYILDDNFAF